MIASISVTFAAWMHVDFSRFPQNANFANWILIQVNWLEWDKVGIFKNLLLRYRLGPCALRLLKTLYSGVEGLMCVQCSPGGEGEWGLGCYEEIRACSTWNGSCQPPGTMAPSWPVPSPSILSQFQIFTLLFDGQSRFNKLEWLKSFLRRVATSGRASTEGKINTRG